MISKNHGKCFTPMAMVINPCPSPRSYSVWWTTTSIRSKTSNACDEWESERKPLSKVIRENSWDRRTPEAPPFVSFFCEQIKQRSPFLRSQVISKSNIGRSDPCLFSHRKEKALVRWRWTGVWSYTSELLFILTGRSDRQIFMPLSQTVTSSRFPIHEGLLEMHSRLMQRDHHVVLNRNQWSALLVCVG